MPVANSLILIISLFLVAGAGAESCPDSILKMQDVSNENCKTELLIKAPEIYKHIVDNFEGSTVFLSKPKGSGVMITQPLQGEVIPLTLKKLVLVVGQSAHYLVEKSYIFNTNLKLVKEITHQPISYFGVSEDDAIFWLVNNYVDSKLLSTVNVYDSSGNIIKSITVDRESTLSITFEGKDYCIYVAKPEMPG